MSGLQVTDVAVPELLKKLKRGEWLVPEFQRQFVWTVSDAVELVNSIFDSRPIGMATLWEQPDETELPLEPISIPDDPGDEDRKAKFYAPLTARPAKLFAILDGKQRCTAIAMAFGGLKSGNPGYRFAGRFYLDVATQDPAQRIVFLKDSEVKKRHIENDAACIAAGLFPLASSLEGEEILAQWMRYLQCIRSQQFYPGGVLPSDDELNRRDRVLKSCFEGLVNTKLAVYIVPPTYLLGEICDIFEKLNTTGTKVSTVDLIHSWLYSDTAKTSDGPILLRDWMDELGQQDGAVGWASSADRPELVAQIVTACYISLDQKPAPRKVGRSHSGTISSIKSGDLLGVPTEHWKNVTANTELVSEFLRDFQEVVAGGAFPYTACPYPASVSVYVGLRWHSYFDHAAFADRPWARTELDALFRAFFWRNALINRYDQGFLTKLGTDLRELRSILDDRPKYKTVAEWASASANHLSRYLHAPPYSPLPDEKALFEGVTDGRPSGAAQKTFTLPMLAGTKADLVDPAISLRFPSNEAVEMHHIYPKSWCSNSKSGKLATILDKTKAGKDWVNSIANMMPLSRRTNNAWKIRLPGQIISEQKISFSQMEDRLKPLFINEECFKLLLAGTEGIPKFWEKRAHLIVKDLLRKTEIIL